MAKGRGEHVREVIFRFFKSIGMRDRFDENMAISFWDNVVGKEIAHQTVPQKVLNGVMLVLVENPVWRHELIFMKQQIIQKLNQKIGKRVIKDIKFL